MNRVITIANHKGGVGKTTSAINIGAGLNKLGKRVLLIDLDSQANLSQSLGILEPRAMQIVTRLLEGEYLKPLTISKGLDLIPSSLDLSGWEIGNRLRSELYEGTILRDNLGDSIEGIDKYEFILIDCPPSLGILTINAIRASREVYIPLQPQYLPLKGFTKLLEIVRKISSVDGQEVRIFITQYDKRKKLHRNVAEALEENFREMLFTTRIRDNVALAEAPVKGEDIYRYAPHSYGAEDYLSLCKEILKLKKG